MSAQRQRVIAVDVAWKWFDPAWPESATIERLPHTATGMAQVLRRAQQWAVERIAEEAMGGWETPLAAALTDAGLTVVLVNPRQVPAYARAVGGLAKTDRLDTGVLCDFSREQQSADPQLPRAAQSQW